MYNLTGLYEADTISKLVVFANDSTSQILMTLFSFALFFIMLMVLKRYDFDQGLLTASFISFVLALVMNYANLISFYIALVYLILAAFTAFYVFVMK